MTTGADHSNSTFSNLVSDLQVLSLDIRLTIYILSVVRPHIIIYESFNTTTILGTDHVNGS